MVSKYIGAYGKQAFVVNFKYSSNTIQEAKKRTAYFCLIENGLLDIKKIAKYSNRAVTYSIVEW